MNKFINIYKENQNIADISNKSKKELLIMLYDGIISNLELASQAMKNKNLAIKLQKIEKTLSIIEIGLISCINKSVSKEVGDSLELFYEDAHRKIILANAQNNVTMLDEVKLLFIDLKMCWYKAV